MSTPVSREEFDALARRVDTIDTSGTRGMGAIALQIAELTKDLTRHEIQHEQEAEQRSSARRWLIGLTVAVIAAIDGPIVTVLLARGR